MIKIVNIEGENVHIFWMTWGISMNFSGKMWVMNDNIKSHKKIGFTLFQKDTFFGKATGGAQSTELLSFWVFWVGCQYYIHDIKILMDMVLVLSGGV